MREIKINPADNVTVDIDSGFKISDRDICCGENIVKYGNPIGHAVKDIRRGEVVHTDNIKTNLSSVIDYQYTPDYTEIKPRESRTISAYDRGNGKIGIRNDIWIIPTVGCVNKVAEALAAKTGAFAFTHPYGCSQLGGDHETTRLILRGLVCHPNAGGVLVIGLGCENNTMEAFKKLLGDYDSDRVKFLVTQEVSDEIAEGEKLIAQLKLYAGKAKRVQCPLSALTVGLKCGGSDGFSGITANPLVGRFSDRLISYGAGTVLSEVPEMFGAEKLLMNRAENRGVFDRIVGMINGYKRYFERYGQVIYENPSPGNKAGGISTLEDKSLGCTQKSGSAPVSDVLGYGDFVRGRGLSLLDGPGNDMVAVTNLTAVGCHLILFTTGRGTPLGAPVPTIKISSNTALFSRKPDWIDFDAGRILSGCNIDDELFDLVIDTANGKLSRNEINGYREIAIFKDGVIL